jgi:hypothetical protein
MKYAALVCYIFAGNLEEFVSLVPLLQPVASTSEQRVCCCSCCCWWW